MEDDFLFVAMAASVNGNEEVMASAFNAKRDFRIVAEDNRAHVEAVWCYGGERYGIALRHDDRSAYAERVGCGACRRANDEPVGLIGGEVLTVDAGVDAYHRRYVVFENCSLVECERVVLYVEFVA